MKAPLSVVIGCPHPLKTQGVVGILKEGGHIVAAVASGIEGVNEAVAESNPDIVVVDGCLCGEDMSTIQGLVKERRTVVVLAGPEREAPFIQQTLQAGALGCLCCDDSPDRFLHSLELLSQGTMVISREHSLRLTEHVDPDRPPRDVPLSRREQQVAAMVARGATNQEIADELFLSTHTVKIHIKNILDKLDLRNRQQLAAHIAREGLVEDVALVE